MGNTINPPATYQYVYYSISGSHSRQPRTGTTPVLVNVPGVPEPGSNYCLTGEPFYVNPPAQSYPTSPASTESYQLSFINVLGLVEGGQIISNPATNNWSNPVGTVGTNPIDVLVVYILIGGSSGPQTDWGITIDALDITTGNLISDTFAKVYDPGSSTPNAAETNTANVDGWVDTTAQTEKIIADAPNSITYPGGATSNEVFQQWQVLYGPVASGNNLTVKKQTDANALAFYKSPLVWPCPCPYVAGGGQSADIILLDPANNNQQVPWDNEPDGFTLLTPNHFYTLQASVHNDSPNDAMNIQVTFCELNGGTGLTPDSISTQTIPLYFILGGVQIPNSNNAPIIPANSIAVFQSSLGFWSGQSPLFPSVHNCAAVSVYNPLSPGCCPQPTPQAITTGSYWGNPLYHLGAGVASCIGWRNTDSMIVLPGDGFHFGLGLGKLKIELDAPVEIEVQTKYVPLEWNNEGEAKAIAGIFKTAGVQLNYPLNLLPSLQHTLKHVDLKTIVSMEEGTKLKTNADKRYLLDTKKEKSTSYVVSGLIPDTARTGDKYMVTVTAHYKATQTTPAMSADFVEYLYVKK
jgi:hypothetical protein